MTDDEQLAESVKYCPDVWHFMEISLGLYALYNHERKPVVITRDWQEVLNVYLSRPIYIPKPRISYEPKITGIDLSLLEITI